MSRFLKTGLPIALSIITVGLFHYNFISEHQISVIKTISIWVYLTVLFYAVNYFIIKYLRKIRQNFSQKTLILITISGVVLGSLFIGMYPIDYRNQKPKEFKVTVTATGEKNQLAQGAEAWILSITVDKQPLDLPKMKLAGGWELRDNVLLSNPQQGPQTLEFYIKAKQKAEILFLSHPWSGIAEVNYNGHREVLDLYDKGGNTKEIQIIPNQVRTHFTVLIALYMATLTIISFYIASLMAIALYFFPQRKKQSVGVVPKWKILVYGLPILLNSLIYLVGFYPGIMTVDSIAQWKQIHTGHYNDLHPIAHTLFNAAWLQIYDHPITIALVQIILLSLVTGYMIYLFEQNGVRKRILYLSLLFISILPVHGMMVITLWKDVPYSILLLLLTLLFCKILFSNGEWLQSRKNLIVLILLGIVIMFIRHNGPAPVLFSIFTLIFLIKVARKKALIAFIVTIIIFGGVKYIVYPAVGVEKLPFYFTGINKLQLMAKTIVTEEPGYELANSLFRQFYDTDHLKEDYNDYNVNGLLFTGHINLEKTNQLKDEINRLWIKLVLLNPIGTIESDLNLASLLWRIHPQSNAYTYTVEQNISPNEFDLKTNPLSKSVNATLSRMLTIISETNLFILLWRPALLLYLIIVSALYLYIKRGIKFLLPLTPVLGNSIGLLISMVSQDYRYLYATLLIFPVSILMLFVPETNSK